MTYDELGFVPYGRHRELAINGRGLSTLVQVNGMACAFAWLDGREYRQLVKQLLLRAPSELPLGRCPIYICERCGDLECGTVRVRVSEVEDCFVWSELSYESPTDGAHPARWFDERAERAFYFEREHYLSVIY